MTQKEAVEANSNSSDTSSAEETATSALLPATPSAEEPNQKGEGKKKRKGKRKKKKGSKKLCLNLPENIEQVEPLDPKGFPNTKIDGRGKAVPQATIPNIRHMLDQYGIQIWYDIIRLKVVVIIPGLEGCPDNADNAALAYVRSLATLNGISSNNIGDYIIAIANSRQKNSVADWIESKKWDGTDRLKSFYDTLTTVEGYPEELKTTLLFRWLISAVAAAFTPSGFHSRGVLVLQGPQSIGKTHWVKGVVPDPMLQERVIKVDHHLDAASADSRKTALSHWIVELGELESSLSRNAAQLKGFITSNMDKFRLPYARTDSEFARRTVFCATVNKSDFLVDDSGNTRWWTIAVTAIDYEHDIDMQQVFAQVHTFFTAKEQWWLTREEEEMLEELNKDHQATSAIRDIIESTLDFSQKASWNKAPVLSATSILQVLDIQTPTNTQVKECGAVMRDHLGDPVRSNGVRGWRVKFPAQEEPKGVY